MSAVGHAKERREEEAVSVLGCSIISLTLRNPHFGFPIRVPLSTWQAGGAMGSAGVLGPAPATDAPVHEHRQGAGPQPGNLPLQPAARDPWGAPGLREACSKPPRAGLPGS